MKNQKEKETKMVFIAHGLPDEHSGCLLVLITICMQDFTYAALGKGIQCYCSNVKGNSSLLHYVDGALCDLPCSGDKLYHCGGEQYLSLYRTNVPGLFPIAIYRHHVSLYSVMHHKMQRFRIVYVIKMNFKSYVSHPENLLQLKAFDWMNEDFTGCIPNLESTIILSAIQRFEMKLSEDSGHKDYNALYPKFQKRYIARDHNTSAIVVKESRDHL